MRIGTKHAQRVEVRDDTVRDKNDLNEGGREWEIKEINFCSLLLDIEYG
jgi:hypothetical protein